MCKLTFLKFYEVIFQLDNTYSYNNNNSGNTNNCNINNVFFSMTHNTDNSEANNER